MNKTDDHQGTRKQRSKNGERTQKMMSFRVDNENLDWILKQENKGRYLNQLIAADRNK